MVILENKKTKRVSIQFPNYQFKGLPLILPMAEGVRQEDIVANLEATTQYLLRQIKSNPKISMYRFTPLSPYEDINSVGSKVSAWANTGKSLEHRIKKFVEIFKPNPYDTVRTLTKQEADQIMTDVNMKELKDFGISYIAYGENAGMLEFVQDPEFNLRYADVPEINKEVIYLPTKGVFGKGILKINSIPNKKKNIAEYVLSKVQGQNHSHDTSLPILDRDTLKRKAWRVSCLRSYVNKTKFPMFPKPEEMDLEEKSKHFKSPTTAELKEMISNFEPPVLDNEFMEHLPIIDSQKFTYKSYGRSEPRDLILLGDPKGYRILEVRDGNNKVIYRHAIHNDSHYEKLINSYKETLPKEVDVDITVSTLTKAAIKPNGVDKVFRPVFRRELTDGTSFVIQVKSDNIIFEKRDGVGGRVLRRSTVIDEEHFEHLSKVFLKESESIKISN